MTPIHTASREPTNASGDLGQLDAVELRGLVARLKSENSSLASLSNFLQMQAEREKAALARELHDSLGGLLTPAKMDLAWLEARLGSDPQYAPRLKRLSDLIDEGIDLKRRIIEALRPSLLDHLGLASALQWHVDDACRAAGVTCRLTIDDSIGRLAPELEITLYRMVQEMVANVVRHSRAASLEMELVPRDGGLRLVVSDDGVGIEQLETALLSHGFSGMIHRVKSVEGTFDIKSASGKGTRIEVFVPLKGRSQETGARGQ
jgi:signal transduction histidine kinase